MYKTFSEKQLREALSFDPDLASAHNGMGVVMGNQNRLAEATEYWKKAVELDKTQYDALYNLCIALTKLNQFQEAIKHMERFIKSAPPQKYASDIESINKLYARLKEAIKK
jgi:tetratricopeptide (TPR) repeat protein